MYQSATEEFHRFFINFFVVETYIFVLVVLYVYNTPFSFWVFSTCKRTFFFKVVFGLYKLPGLVFLCVIPCIFVFLLFYMSIKRLFRFWCFLRVHDWIFVLVYNT